MTFEQNTSLPSLQELNFDFKPRTRVISGVNCVEKLGDLARQNSRAGRVLLVTDAGVAAAGHVARVVQLLEKAGLQVTVFDQSEQNPSTRCVNKCVETARASNVDLIIGLGGGSSLDTAKGCNFILTNGGSMKDYWGVGKARQPMLPFIAIPTTAGTGSEMQSFAIISDEHTHQKMACGDSKAAAFAAFLDPSLTLSQPPMVTACAGLDALAHAIETAVCKQRNALSLMFSREAFRLGAKALPTILRNPHDLVARGQMLLAAAWAGLAIEKSMLGAAHASANPLTAHYNITHGLAVAIMLPWVIRFNANVPAAADGYRQLANLMDNAFLNTGDDASEKLAGCLEELLDLATLPRTLKALGVNKKDIPKLAVEANKQWTAVFNPKSVSVSEFEKLYESAFGN